MIDPIVRPAVPVDLAALVELELEARSVLVNQRGGDRWLQEHPLRGPEWAQAVSGGTEYPTTVFVGLIDEVAVGYLVLEQPAPRLAVVEQVYVTPAAREVGIGDELLITAIEHARTLGVAVFEGQALPGDRETKNLYERAKITARSITVSKRLDT